MKIVQVYTEFLPSLGGIQLNIYNLAKRLVRRGHEVTVLTTNLVGGMPAKLPFNEVIEGIKVIRLESSPTNLSYRYAITNPSRLLSVDADLFHVFSFLPYFLTNIACLISKLRRMPLVVTPTYHPFRQLFYRSLAARVRKHIYDDLLGLKLLKLSKWLIALTRVEADYYHNMGIKNVAVVPIGVDLPANHLKQTLDVEINRLKKSFGLNGRVVLHIGRLEWRKGIQYALKALALVLNREKDVKLLLVGSDAGYYSNLKNQVRKLDIEDNVVFAGRLSHSDLSYAYELADVVLIPSIFESFSHIAIEAFAHKKPVIVSKTTGFAERITTDNGILVNTGDYSALARAILRLLSDRSLSRSMGVKGFKMVEKEFTWEHVTDRLEAIYQSVK